MSFGPRVRQHFFKKLAHGVEVIPEKLGPGMKFAALETVGGDTVRDAGMSRDGWAAFDDEPTLYTTPPAFPTPMTEACGLTPPRTPAAFQCEEEEEVGGWCCNGGGGAALNPPPPAAVELPLIALTSDCPPIADRDLCRMNGAEDFPLVDVSLLVLWCTKTVRRRAFKDKLFNIQNYKLDESTQT
jgi:hypothetical protein